MQREQNRSKAIILAILILLTGAIVFGLLYQTSIMTSIAIFASTYLASLAYSKNAKPSWWTYVWMTFFAIIFSITAMIVSTIIYVARTIPCSFAEAGEYFFNTFDNPEMQKAFIHDFLFVVSCAVFGLVLDIISLIAINIMKKKKTSNHTKKVKKTKTNKNEIENLNIEENSEKNYRYFITKLEGLLNDYNETKNQETLKSGLFEIKRDLILLDSMKRAVIENQVEETLSAQNLDKLSKQANQILLKLVK